MIHFSIPSTGTHVFMHHPWALAYILKIKKVCNTDLFVSLSWAQLRSGVGITELNPQMSPGWWRAHQTRPQHHWTRGAGKSCDQGSCDVWSVKRNTELFGQCDRTWWDFCSETVHLFQNCSLQIACKGVSSTMVIFRACEMTP